MKVHVRAFARMRELLGESDFDLEVSHGATLADCWAALVARNVEIASLAGATRLARNGRIVPLLDERVSEGDEVAVLPPVGGG